MSGLEARLVLWAAEQNSGCFSVRAVADAHADLVSRGDVQALADRLALDGWLLTPTKGNTAPEVTTNLGGAARAVLQSTTPAMGAGFSFTVRQDPGSSSWLVGLGSYREIEIGGEPAVIVTGGWDAGSREWAWLEHTTLIWTVDGVQYTLGASADSLAEVDLIAIAESVR